jgi:DNA-binding transcriptional ArsR family regulator
VKIAISTARGGAGLSFGRNCATVSAKHGCCVTWGGHDAALGPVGTRLKPAQRVALAALNEGSAEELTRGDYQQLTGVSRSQAAYDLAELVDAGLLERVGGGRSTRYRRTRRAQPSHRRWTNERIRAALLEFCAGRTTWPSAGEFKAAGHTDLYVAASRYGGIRSWASELGFSGPARTAPRQRRSRSLPASDLGCTAAAFAAVLLASAARWFSPTRPPTRGRPERPAPGTSCARLPHRHRPGEAKPARPTRRSNQRPPVAHSSTPRYRGVITSSPRRELASQTISAPVITTPTQHPAARPVSTADGVAPLRAPGGAGSAPSPLPAPRQ